MQEIYRFNQEFEFLFNAPCKFKVPLWRKTDDEAKCALPLAYLVIDRLLLDESAVSLGSQLDSSLTFDVWTHKNKDAQLKASKPVFKHQWVMSRWTSFYRVCGCCKCGHWMPDWLCQTHRDSRHCEHCVQWLQTVTVGLFLECFWLAIRHTETQHLRPSCSARWVIARTCKSP